MVVDLRVGVCQVDQADSGVQTADLVVHRELHSDWPLR